MAYILFTGGGSAGHVVPNLAIMQLLRTTHKLAYLGTGGIEERLVGQEGYLFFRVDCPKLIRSATPKNLLIPFRLAKACREAKKILRQERPDLVFSKGGYASFPAVKAARALGIPVLTHESDVSAGLCTKLIAKKCVAVLTSFPETAARFRNGICVGPPVRRELFSGDRARGLRKYRFDGNKPVLLVLGGGSGSRALNEAVRRNLGRLLPKFDILHLCGKGNLLPVQAAGYVQTEYENDMGDAYACADAVLSRAGSNTLFELMLLRKRALLVPLMRGSRGDQAENAEYFRRKGLCRVLPETELARLPEALSALLCDDGLRDALVSSPVRDGTENITRRIVGTAEAHSRGTRS